MADDVIFQPLQFKNLTVKNRIFRSNISGRFDNYDGSGNQARINWEVKFARGGVGAIISSFVPVHIRGRIIPNYATIDTDERIPFWRKVGEAVQAHDCKYILQLSHGGRQRDIAGVEYPLGLSSTDKKDPLHGFECQRMTLEDIRETVAAFAEGARRAREAGLDGVELHGANGYLITQFLSSAINDRKDEYGGPLENRARFVIEIVKAIRARVGADFHLQMKISATEFNDAVLKFEGSGNTVQESARVCRWLEEAGADSIPASPQPRGQRSPAGSAGADVRLDDFERDEHLPQLPAVPRRPHRAPVQAAVARCRRSGRPHRGAHARRFPNHQGGGDGAGDLHRRLPDRVGDSRGDSARRL
jgi:2,4-dienoyl-CoA reductase (NADPH2)